MKTRLVLASSSIYRKDLLDRLGLPFEQDSPRVDEDVVKRSGLGPEQIAHSLASAKAQEVSDRHPDSLVIGSDQLVDMQGRVLGKPGSAAGCRAQLAQLSGKRHRLITALCLRTPEGNLRQHLDVHEMHMRTLTESEISRYVAAERPWDCAGSYKIEARGISLFERIVGEDFSAIIGLPLMALTGMLRAEGVTLP